MTKEKLACILEAHRAWLNDDPMTYKKHIPRCDDDCEHCKRPPEKCHGGSGRKAYDARKKTVGKAGAKIKSQGGTGHKVCRGRLGRM